MIKLHSSRALPFGVLALSIASQTSGFSKASDSPTNPAQTALKDLEEKLEIGDVVFIRSKAMPFRKVAETTGSWTNHVGIVLDVSGKNALVAESTFPFSKVSTMCRFVGRSEAGRVAVMRLKSGLTVAQQERIRAAAVKRLRIFYDTGFDLHSPRQFCSRFVREIIDEATGIQVGEVENFEHLLSVNPAADRRFWNLWYFGNIPWKRETVTPARVLESPELRPVFDGCVA